MAKMDQQGTQDQYRHVLPAGGDGQENVSAFVGRGVEFKGTIIYDGTIQIDGILEGEIQTSGCLLVGDGAVLTAKVSAGVVISKGTITGDIVAKEKVDLRAPAVLNGSVVTPMLAMEEGVLFNGKIDMAHSGQGHGAEYEGKPAGRDRRFAAEVGGAGNNRAAARPVQSESVPLIGTQDD